MRARDQLIGALTLAIATYYGVLRIAEAKSDAAVGSLGVLLDTNHPDDLAAFRRLQSELGRLGQAALADRLEELRVRRDLRVAPGLGPERWAATVQSLGLVNRIYIRRLALLNPRLHLYPTGAIGIPEKYQVAFASLSLGGAMRHELAHYDGATEEAEAYRVELAWYEDVRGSAFVTGLEGNDRATWDWALESAISSARKAAMQAGVEVSS